MRHRKKINHLSRKSAHRRAMLSNMASSLILHKRIHTTVAKAKALRIYVEPLNSYPIPPYAKPPVKIEPRSESKLPNLEDIRKRLRIELADLSDREVDEFLNLDLP